MTEKRDVGELLSGAGVDEDVVGKLTKLELRHLDAMSVEALERTLIKAGVEDFLAPAYASDIKSERAKDLGEQQAATAPVMPGEIKVTLDQPRELPDPSELADPKKLLAFGLGEPTDDIMAPQPQAYIERLSALGYCVVYRLDDDGGVTQQVDVDSTHQMWSDGNRGDCGGTYGRDDLPVGDPREMYEPELVEIDPWFYPNKVRLADGFNDRTKADYGDVPVEDRAIIAFHRSDPGGMLRDKSETDVHDAIDALQQGTSRGRAMRRTVNRRELGQVIARLADVPRRETVSPAQQHAPRRPGRSILHDAPSTPAPASAVRPHVNIPTNPRKALIHVLGDTMVDPDELRMFIRDHVPEIANSVNWNASMTTVTHNVADTLFRRGLSADTGLWNALRQKAPGKRDMIDLAQSFCTE